MSNETETETVAETTATDATAAAQGPSDDAVLAALGSESLTISQLATKLSCASKDIKATLQRLRKENRLVTEGQKRGTRYKLAAA